MACDDLSAGLTRAGNPGGSLGTASRPSGSVGRVGQWVGGGVCRTFSFAPPVVIPASQIVTFVLGDAINTFAGETLYTF